MKRKWRTTVFLVSAVIFCIAGYNLWTLRPVSILYVEADWRSPVIVVDHFPLTDKDRINWFLNHENEIKKHYGIITELTTSIDVIDAAGGFFRLEDYPQEDLYCFDSIKSDKRCVQKNIVLEIEIHVPGVVDFQTGNGLTYRISDDGKIETKSY
ncbi:DUF943 family protein [Scandinavium manionii]|uniref:DUF943 family protein n=1 Tax=Scandinavium manionii TaxID=2926520 RepID=UPI002165BE53|nr:DUF943 family protein [Scandinavium manionii]MCS2148471.1 DUF943 family protein [Scandinavium manionii]